MHSLTTKSESLEEDQNLNILETPQFLKYIYVYIWSSKLHTHTHTHTHTHLWTADLEQDLRVTLA